MVIDIIFVIVAVIQFIISLFTGYLMGETLVKPKGLLYEIAFVCAFFSTLISMLITRQILGDMTIIPTFTGLLICFFIPDLWGDKKQSKSVSGDVDE